MSLAPGDWDPHAGGYFIRRLPDGRLVWVVRMIASWRIVIGPPEAPGYDDCWEYSTMASAILEALVWDVETEPEPAGWIRHPSSGRRRENGDPAREVVRP